ncbi:hypothetical protein FGO68_gene14489 [Halteria grandinella]|uniref:Uncharacterized protein n=1 Tax=Halteria grandinella TaxID=5974 RepID=A0A8J8T7B0_HALGN|nr:hypothetical protein FGO68_gene14489 [Halteria grandinella]
MNATLSPVSITYFVVSRSSQSVSLTRTIMPGLTDVPCTNISSFSLRCFLFSSSISLSIVHCFPSSLEHCLKATAELHCDFHVLLQFINPIQLVFK